MAEVFISYSRKNEGEVKRLVQILERMRHRVHYDQDHSGGHVWWDAILADIRRSSIFIIALSYDYLDSLPCSLEFHYALALNKHILPVMVGQVDYDKVPANISRLNVVQFTKNNEDDILDLAGAVNELDKMPIPELLDPLPEPPNVPIPRISFLLERLAKQDIELTLSEQEAIFNELLGLYLKQSSRENARFALMKLRQRSELRAHFAEKIDDLLELSNARPEPISEKNKNNAVVPQKTLRNRPVFLWGGLAIGLIGLIIVAMTISRGWNSKDATATSAPLGVAQDITITSNIAIKTDTPINAPTLAGGNNTRAVTVTVESTITLTSTAAPTNTLTPTYTASPTRSLAAMSNYEKTSTAMVPMFDVQVTPAEFGSGGTHISFWNGLTGSDGVAIVDLLTSFVKEHPEISITLKEVPWGVLYAKLQDVILTDTSPDIVILHSAELPQFASQGQLQDLGSWYSDRGGFFPVDDITPTTRAGMDYKAVTYGIPYDNHGRGLWINRDDFKRAGVDPDIVPPTNYNGWVNLFQLLALDNNGKNATDPVFDPTNVAQWGFAVGEWPRVNFMSALVQNGGNWLSADGKTITVNSDIAVKVLQQFVDLVYKYHVSPPPSGYDTWQGFGAGTVAILPTGTWFRNQAMMFTDIDSEAWTNFQFGQKPATWFGIHTWMVPVGVEADKLNAVKTLVEWISNNQLGVAVAGQVPARISLQDKLDPINYPSNITIGKSVQEYGTSDWSAIAVDEIYAALDLELDAALDGQKTARQALDDAARNMQQILNRTQP